MGFLFTVFILTSLSSLLHAENLTDLLSLSSLKDSYSGLLTEVREHQVKQECKHRQFQCANKKCIQASWKCDGEVDCDDGSDEIPEECKVPKSCKEKEFTCANGRCIPNHWVCDKEKDCQDGSDEHPDACEKTSCSPDQFSCRRVDNGKVVGAADNSTCFPLPWMCDGQNDCPDGFDEMSCSETCRPGQLTCGNGRCVKLEWACDSDDDCGDKTDELNCFNSSCSKDMFTCASKECVPMRWKCDGDPDCSDGSDEKDCPTTETKNVCSGEEFMCSDRITCLHSRWVCDGDKDCPQGEDEDIKLCHTEECRIDEFRCANNHQCIPGSAFCNGHADCSDGSDEADCHKPKVTCLETEFDCGEGECIALSKVCDLVTDCASGEDETDTCGKNECLVNNGGCSHTCVNTPNSFYCSCRPGYKLVDNHTCDDINECENPGACSQICINEKGTFKCECENGYLRDPQDRTRCKATEGHASLLFTRRHDIRKISLDHHEMTAIVNDTKTATALDFVFRTGMIFWSDASDKKIYKAPIDEGNERTVVINDEITLCDGLAVDWLYGHIYWADAGKNTIELANYDGNMRKTLIKDDLDEPRALTVNPLDGWMYWSDWGKVAKIEKAGMDGSRREVIVDYDIKWPNGLTLDLVRERLYWVDAKLNLISSVNYDGSARRTILRSRDVLGQPFSISVFEDFLYWTDWDKQAIFKANKFNGSSVQAVTALHMMQNPMVVHVYHPFRQPDGVNHCAAVNGHCSHLCLPAPQINNHSPKISCACPDGLILMKDRLMCTEEVSGTDAPSTSTITADTHNTQSTGSNNQSNDRMKSDNYVESDSGMVALIAMAIVGAVFIGVCMVGIAVYRHYLHRNVTSMNFDNPVYRKTVEDQFSLDKDQHQPHGLYPEESQEPLTSPGTNDYV